MGWSVLLQEIRFVFTRSGDMTRAREIAQSISKSILNDTSIVDEELKNPEPHDIPGDWFKGPF